MKVKVLGIYDNGGKTIDRYTVVYNLNSPKGTNLHISLSMSENPNSPLGYCQHGVCFNGSHLGKKISVTDLPFECQKVIANELKN